MSIHIPVAVHGHHLHVPVEAGGEALSFLLDTGAGTSLLASEAARRLGAAFGRPFAARGAGDGSAGGHFLEAPVPVAPGGHPGLLLGLRAALPLDDIAAVEGVQVDGILGFDFIDRHVVEIDYRARELRLHDPEAFAYADGAGDTVPLTLETGLPHVAGTIVLPGGRGVSADVVVDLGSSLGAALTHRFAAAHGIDPSQMPARPFAGGRGIGGEVTARLVRLGGIQIGRISIDEPVAAIFEEGAGVMTSGAFFDATVGGEVLRRFTVVLDYRRRHIILEPNDDFGRPYDADASGLTLMPVSAADQSARVTLVEPGTPAAAAGVCAGDTLIAIDDRPLDGIGIDDARALLTLADRRYLLTLRRGEAIVRAAIDTVRLL